MHRLKIFDDLTLIFYFRLAAEFAEPVVDVHPSLRHRKEALPDGSARTGEVEEIRHGNSFFLYTIVQQYRIFNTFSCSKKQNKKKELGSSTTF